MSTQVTLSKSVIDEAVHEAYAREGYLKTDGSRCNIKLRERVCEIVVQHQVSGRREREEKAIKRGELVAIVFPSVPGPEQWDELQESERPLAEATYGKINSDVWTVTQPSADKYLQDAVGKAMGNGYVACRTKVGAENVDAVYITDVLECIRLDFVRPDNESLKRRLLASTRNREMLVLRQPHNAKTYGRDYEKMLRAELTAASTQVQLAIETATAPSPDEGDEEAAE